MTLVEVNEKADFTFDEAVKKRLCRLQNDYRWIITHKKELRDKYPKKYIAVENKTVRFTANTIKELISQIASQKEQIENFAVEYISEHPVNFLF